MSGEETGFMRSSLWGRSRRRTKAGESARAAIITCSAVAAVLAVGCGGNETVASSTPTLAAPSSAATAAPTTTSADGAKPSDDAEASDGAEAAGASEAPETSDVPYQAEREAYLDALRDGGITLADSGDTALSAAAYVCSADSEGVSEDEVLVVVTALAGQEAQLAGAQVDPEAAGRTYVEAAREHLCSVQ
jgi:hypothetical protein